MVSDLFRDKMEDIIGSWDKMDINPKSGKYTWSIKQTRDQYIAACLDQFLIHNG